MGDYFHNVPGRLRIRSSRIKANPQLIERVQALLGQHVAITSTAANPVTGSVLIHYDPTAISQKEILALLCEEDCFDAAKAVPHDKYVEAVVAKATGYAGRTLAGALLNSALERAAVSVLAALI